jgi:hypothetical protein
MPSFYRGAGVGTYWHQNDARLNGFLPHHATVGAGASRVLGHIARGTAASPYVSLTRSYAVARQYALSGLLPPLAADPAYVYEVEIDEHDGAGTRLVDPVVEIAKYLGSPYDARTYHHDGDLKFILGIAESVNCVHHLHQPVLFPPPGEGTPRTPLLHIELEALVRALRDAEVLALGAIAASQVKRRIDVY